MKRLPTHNDDWSQTYEVIHETVKDWLGKTKMLAEPVERDGDVSFLPTSDESYNDETGDYTPPSTWNEKDRFSDLMEGCTGNTIATYVSGMGLGSETIGDVLHDRVRNCTEYLFLEINKIDEDEAFDFDFDPYEHNLSEMAQDVLVEMENLTLESVLSETKRQPSDLKKPANVKQEKRVIYKNIRQYHTDVEVLIADAQAHKEWDDVKYLKDRLHEIETKMTADQFELLTADYDDAGFSPKTATQMHKELYDKVMEQEKNGVDYPDYTEELEDKK